MTQGEGNAPAGWYPVGDEQRYWDGQQWTEHRAPVVAAAAPAATQDKTPDKRIDKRADRVVQREAKRAEQQLKSDERKAAATSDVRPDIAAAMSKMSHKWGSKREIRKLPEHLWEGEVVQLLTSGTYGSGTGILALTDRRLFFLKDGFTSKTSEDFPLDKISSIQWSTGILLGKIIVFTSGAKAEIEQVQKLDGKAITDAVRERISSGSRSVPPTSASPLAQTAPAGPAPDDPYERLRKLGELRDAGILTDEEFQAKKQQILDSAQF